MHISAFGIIFVFFCDATAACALARNDLLYGHNVENNTHCADGTPGLWKELLVSLEFSRNHSSREPRAVGRELAQATGPVLKVQDGPHPCSAEGMALDEDAAEELAG